MLRIKIREMKLGEIYAGTLHHTADSPSVASVAIRVCTPADIHVYDPLNRLLTCFILTTISSNVLIYFAHP